MSTNFTRLTAIISFFFLPMHSIFSTEIISIKTVAIEVDVPVGLKNCARYYSFLIIDNRDNPIYFEFNLNKLRAEFDGENIKLDSNKLCSSRWIGYLKGFCDINIVPAGQMVAGVVWFDYEAKNFKDDDIKLSYGGKILGNCDDTGHYTTWDLVNGLPVIFYAEPLRDAVVMEGYVGAWHLPYRVYKNIPNKQVSNLDIKNIDIMINSYFFEKNIDKINVYVAVELRNKLPRPPYQLGDPSRPKYGTVFLENILRLEVNNKTYTCSTSVKIFTNRAGGLRGFGEPAILELERKIESGIIKFSIPIQDEQYLKNSFLVYSINKIPLRFHIKTENVFYLLPAAVYGDNRMPLDE